MRKYLLIIGIVAIAIGCNNAFATGDKQITSKTYVTNQLATKQDKIPAVDTNTVITHTGTNGEIGQKAIYDSGENYVSQQTALMTAGDANTGINTALENEFICIDWDTDGTCLLWNIKNTSPQRILPTGYTALEYIESTGTQYIDTGIQGTSNIGVSVDFQYTNSETNEQILFGVVAPNFAFWRIGTTHFSYAYKNGTGPTGYVGIPDTNEHTLDVNFYNNGLMRFDGNIKSLPNDIFSNVGNMYVFSSFYSSYPSADYHGSAAKIFNFRLTNGTTLVRDMIAARRDSDGELGMYDLVSNTFFTNQGSGTFTAGPVLDVYIPSGN